MLGDAPHGPVLTPIPIRSDGAGIEVIQVNGGDAQTWGPHGETRWVQVHGVVSAQVEYVIAPPVGSFPGLFPDRYQLPDQRTPILLPAGCGLTLANVGAGARTFVICYTIGG